MLFFRYIIEKTSQTRNLAGTGCSLIAALSLEIVHVFISVVQCDGLEQLNADIVDFDLLKIHIVRHELTGSL